MSNVQRFSLFIVPLGFVTVILIFASTFVINEGQQGVITQFGRPVRTVSEAGLHFKTPFVQDVRRIDSRILNWDGYPNQIPTKDKKYIEVDTTARWKIVDPLKFIQTVQNERGARSRLDAILDGVTRDVISSQNLVEAVRNSNQIFETIQEKKAQIKQREKDGDAVAAEEEEISGEIESISIGREKLSDIINTNARKELEPLGIELIDVQLKRISYEKSVQQKVYSRMVSERQRIAEKIRSMGKGEKAKIEGKTTLELQKIQSQAYRTVQEIKGEAEAKATKIYADSLGRDKRYYEFVRTLEAYEKVLKDDSRLVFSADSKFWKILNDGN